MTAISVFNGLFCEADEVVKRILDVTGYQLVTDKDIIADAVRMSGIDEQAISRTLYKKKLAGDSRFDQRRIISWLRFATAKRLSRGGNQLFWGYMALLPAYPIKNILRVCLISNMTDRLCAGQREGYSNAHARDLVFVDDSARGNWAVAVTDRNDPWATTLYDMILPVGSMGVEQSADLVVQQLTNAAVQDSEPSNRGVRDFLLSSKVETELARKGFGLTATVEKKRLTLCFDNHEDTLQAATRNLLEFVSGFDGVTGVEIGVGRKYNENDIYERALLQGFAITQLAEIPGGADDDEDDFEPLVVLDEDSRLAATIQAVLLQQGQDISVFTRNGFVSLVINDHKLFLKCVSRELCELVGSLDGVEEVEVGIGREYHQIARITKIRRNLTKEFISRDDREFDQFLSQRLRLGAVDGNFAACTAITEERVESECV